jgi:hypothetical protein
VERGICKSSSSSGNCSLRSRVFLVDRSAASIADLFGEPAAKRWRQNDMRANRSIAATRPGATLMRNLTQRPPAISTN